MKATVQLALILGTSWGYTHNEEVVELPRWCGKPYESGSPNIDPGGQFEPPRFSNEPMLYFRAETRHSIYVSDEFTGELMVDATLSHIHGQPWPFNISNASVRLSFDAIIEETNLTLAREQISVNSPTNLVEINFTGLEPRLDPYLITLCGFVSDANLRESFTTTASLLYLPTKRIGSMVKIDNLHGGMLVANNATDYAFEPLLPFGFYTGCWQYLNYSSANVTAYHDLGLTAINPGCAFDGDDLNFLFDWLDGSNLWYQYNMRWSYTNLTWVREQIPHVRDRSNLLSWYTADEPDGVQDPLNSTYAAYELLKKEDPYHPTGLVLNCENYYFKEYSSGADYILEDAYPIGTNVSFSRKFNTVCNSTYGDCGCDNCAGELGDVSNRLDTFSKYQEWVGGFPKPLWAVLQAFNGEQYWSRDPTPEETWAMMCLSFNHRAKGIMSWVFPTSPELRMAYSKFARMVAVPPVSIFLLASEPSPIKLTSYPMLDIAYWIHGSQMLVGIVNQNYESIDNTITIPLPKVMSRIVGQPWGSLGWGLGPNRTLLASNLNPLASSYIIVELLKSTTNESLLLNAPLLSQQS